MSESASAQPSGLRGLQNVSLADATVRLSGVDQGLLDFAEKMGGVHIVLFGEPMVITSGNDGVHVPGSAHLKGKALDVRSHDLTGEEQLLFGFVMAYFAPAFKVGIFDERGLVTAPHWHLEVGMFGS